MYDKLIKKIKFFKKDKAILMIADTNELHKENINAFKNKLITEE